MPEPTTRESRHVAASPLTASVVGGLRWSYTSTLLVTVLQIGVTAVLARLLVPSAFGLVAMASLFLRFGQYFAEMGAGQAVVQRADLSERDVHTAFTSAALLGGIFALVFAAAAPLASILYPDTAGVVAVTRVMALTFVIGGLTSTTQALLRRRFGFRAIALTEMGTYILGYATIALLLASAGFGAWSLVAASLAQGALAAAVYLALCRRQLGFALAWGSLRSIYSYGGRISLIGFLEFIATSLDTLWTGHFLGAGPTGLYTRSKNMAVAPLYQFTTSLSRVLLPAFSRIQTERERLGGTYLASVMVVVAIAAPVAWGVAGSAHEVVLTLLGPKWVEAVPPLAVLSLAVPFTLVMHLSAVSCDAVAALRIRLVITVARIGWLVVLLVALGHMGVTGVAVACSVSEVLTMLAYQLVMRRLLGATAAQLWRAHSVGVGSGIVTGLTLFALHSALSAAHWPPVLILLVQVLVGAVILVASITRARGSVVWIEIRSRLQSAGLGHGEKGAGAAMFRGLDRLAGRRSASA